MKIRTWILEGSGATDAAAQAAWAALSNTGHGGQLPLTPCFAEFVAALLGPARVPVTVMAEQDGEIVGLWPLALETSPQAFGVRCLQHRNRSQAYYAEPLIHSSAPPNVVDHLVAAIHKWRGWDSLELMRIRGGLNAPAGRTDESPAPMIIHADHAIPSSDRKSTARRRRRLEELGGTFTHLHAVSDIVAAAPAFMELHSRLKQHQHQYAMFVEEPVAAGGLPDALSLLARSGAASVVTLEVSGAVVAAQVLLHEPGHTYAWRLGWEPAMASFGLGILMLQQVITLSRERGDRVLHLGPGIEAYKQRWANRNVTTSRWRARRWTLRTAADVIRRRVRSD